ncbi:response regulator [Rhodohalobacter halophilus]|uniref:response regulator n=1 Tax=Rhodohalobacter halophilus TaxID=1812810 RepID=UPI00083F7002|nr:response regulator [Rhodohalobacter halophilus]
MRKDDDSGLILAVDDHRMNLLALKGILTNAGYGFLEASSGEEAIAKVKKHHPDLILMDINMDGMDGYHTTLAIHDIPGHESTPVLFLSGSTEEDDIVRCFTSGGVDYVSKPVRKYELLA